MHIYLSLERKISTSQFFYCLWHFPTQVSNCPEPRCRFRLALAFVNRQKVDKPLRHEPVISKFKTVASSDFALDSVSSIPCVFQPTLFVAFSWVCVCFCDLIVNLIICLLYIYIWINNGSQVMLINYSRQPVQWWVIFDCKGTKKVLLLLFFVVLKCNSI